MGQVVSRKLDIYELPDGRWTCRGRRYRTAFGALNAVRKEDKETVFHGEPLVRTEIIWHPETRIGRLIVQSLEV